jgi:hypothetical protein
MKPSRTAFGERNFLVNFRSNIFSHSLILNPFAQTLDINGLIIDKNLFLFNPVELYPDILYNGNFNFSPFSLEGISP